MNLEKHKTACGNLITIPARVQTHLKAHPDVVAHLPAAINKIYLPHAPQKIEIEVPMDFVVGPSGVAKTNPIKIGDLGEFVFRTNRRFPSRVAPAGTVGDAATSIVVIAKPTLTGGAYELITAWVGGLAEKEPWDPSIVSRDEFDVCLRFWSTTAFVFDPGTMSPRFESSWKAILEFSGSEFS